MAGLPDLTRHIVIPWLAKGENPESGTAEGSAYDVTLRFTDDRRRFWIPGSATRPRNDGEGLRVRSTVTAS